MFAQVSGGDCKEDTIKNNIVKVILVTIWNKKNQKKRKGKALWQN